MLQSGIQKQIDLFANAQKHIISFLFFGVLAQLVRAPR